ncbi:hypothetical protein F4778DRAFT_273140 [Xylariomycetidae sp. FL2044]|nr:hypothetical protein F4778DRAFT_273140 [Xylariomycetidae sp. FL2044]
MQARLLIFLFSLSILASAQDINTHHFPKACRKICDSIAGIADVCETQHDNDSAEEKCVCETANAQTDATDCASCIQAQGGVDKDGVLTGIISNCGWASTDDDVSGGASVKASSIVSSVASQAVLSTVTVTATPTSTVRAVAPIASAGVGGIVVAGVVVALPVIMSLV